ncbi:MAG: hypothetical protein IJU98_11935 [Synergistaceae bacterium]|nr:hypothetical protein [Synergistaceae bacterium]
MRAFLRGNVDFENAEFRRALGSEVRTVLSAPPSKRRPPIVTLVPMRSLSLDAFSFPFSNAAKVREALKLQVLPYSAAGAVEIFPVTLERTGRGTNGVAWYVSPGELELPGEEGSVVWPAPLPFVSRVEGTGVTLWSDEENLCSLLWQEGRPVLSRWRPRAHTAPESELAWFDRYCGERELTRGGTFVFDAEDEEARASLRGIVAESLALCPWLGTVNLSRTALEGAMGLERNVRLMARAACWVLLMGGVVLTGNLLRWHQLQSKAEEVRGRSEALYREVFDPTRTGRIGNPVSLARDRIAQLQGGGSDGRRFEDALADLGEVFQETPSLDVTVDILRYNAEGLDFTGVAPDMSTVLTFRRAWEGRAALSQLDNTQSVPGVGYRFDLRVRW